MANYDEDDLACPTCGASFIEDPHPKLHASTLVKLPNNNPARYQCRCRGCGTRGPKRDARSAAKTDWAKLRQIDQIE